MVDTYDIEQIWDCHFNYKKSNRITDISLDGEIITIEGEDNNGQYIKATYKLENTEILDK